VRNVTHTRLVLLQHQRRAGENVRVEVRRVASDNERAVGSCDTCGATRRRGLERRRERVRDARAQVRGACLLSAARL
jgi:hypothetical protein